jgi:hypothetical protein
MGYWGRGRRTSNIEHPTLNIELEEEEVAFSSIYKPSSLRFLATFAALR